MMEGRRGSRKAGGGKYITLYTYIETSGYEFKYTPVSRHRPGTHNFKSKEADIHGLSYSKD